MIRKLKASFTRPNNATDYADNDLVANNTSAGSVTPMEFHVGPNGGRVVAIRIEKSDGSDVTAADFSIRLFDSSPTVANGDNGAISHNVSGHLKTVDVGAMVAGTDDAYVMIHLGETGFEGGAYCAGPIVYGLLEANAAYVPAALEVFTVYLYVEK